MHQVTFDVKGMTCGHCVRAIKMRLEELSGVLRAEVKLEEAVAIVDFDPLKVSIDRMAAVISDEGYVAEPSRGVS